MKANILKMIGQAVEWKTVDEVVSTITAPTKVKKEVYKISGKIPIIDQGIEFIAGYTDEPLTPVKSDQYVIFGDHSEHIKFVDFAFIQGADGLKILKPKYDNAKYIYHAFLNFYKKELSYKRHWTKAKETLIPIPPLSVQSQIVQILDTFTELNDQLRDELTAELSMRQKQYQYYRDFLLSEHELVKVGFEWKSLGEVGELIRGNGLTKKDLSDDGVPAIHYGQIYTHFGTFATQTKSFVSTALAKKLKKAQNGDVLLAGTSENLKDVMKPLGWLGSEIAISGDMFAFRPNKQQLDTKYLTYLLQAHEFQKYKEKHAHGTKVTRLKSEKFLSFVIPIPPLSVQSQIVAILDTFDTLTQSISEGLPKEIQLRQKQYEYYRERLLTFDAGDGV